MREVHCRLQDLPILHPRLLWETIILAGASVLGSADRPSPYAFHIHAEDIPGFGSGELILSIDPGDFEGESILRLQRTFELSRQVELAAIAVAGLALAHSGGHEIVDVALRGSAADYLVGEPRSRLEIAGRSRRADLESAWQLKWSRFSLMSDEPCFVFVVEFETLTGRLGFG
jgi:hypothetical protein